MRMLGTLVARQFTRAGGTLSRRLYAGANWRKRTSSESKSDPSSAEFYRFVASCGASVGAATVPSPRVARAPSRGNQLMPHSPPRL
jgi:hypothetical protein